MKFLVTGAAGFIGFHVSQALIKRGDEVVGIDNINDYYDTSLKNARLDRLTVDPKFSFYKIDLTEKEAERYISLSLEKYCSVGSTINQKTAINHSFEIVR